MKLKISANVYVLEFSIREKRCRAKFFSAVIILSFFILPEKAYEVYIKEFVCMSSYRCE